MSFPYRVAGVSSVLLLTGAVFLACVGDDAAPSGTIAANDGGTDSSTTTGDGQANDGSITPVDSGDSGDAGDLPPPATGTVKFALTFIGDGSPSIFGNAVAFDGLGNVYAGGGYKSASPVDLGNGKSLPANATQFDGFIAKFDATGKCLWAAVLDGTDDGQKQVFSLAAAPNGEVVFAADTGGAASVKLDGASVAGKGANDVAVGRLSASGQQVFLRTLASPGYEFAESIAVDATGKIALTGKYIRDTATDPAFDGIVANPPVRPNPIGFLALLDANGVTTTLKAFPYQDTGPQSYVNPHSVAFAPDGNVVVGGEFTGTIELRSGEPAGQAVPSAGNNDAWVAKVDTTTNKVIWAYGFGGTGNDNIHGVAVDPKGNVTVCLNYGSALNVGAANLPAPIGSTDVGLLRFDANGGLPVGFSYGSASSDLPAKIAVDRWGNLAVVGLMGDTLTFGTKVATAFGGAGDGFIAKLSPTGTGLWAYGIGGAGNNDQINAVAVDQQGNVASVGTLGGSGSPITLFGKTVNVGPGKYAAFIAVTSP